MSYFFRVGGLWALSMVVYVCMSVSLNASHAQAKEPLTFLEQLEPANAYRLRDYLPAYTPAKTDLNNDGLDEFILRDKSCSGFALCGHKVLAVKAERVVELADFEARKVVLAHETTNGVRALIVYNNPTNDFEYAILKWNAQSSEFKEEAE